MGAETKSTGGVYSAFKSVVGKIIMILFHLRKIVMAIPVLWASVTIASFSMENLHSDVGLFLQTNGDFLYWTDRNTAVIAPLLITVGCLCMMMLSRKASYAWAISIFSLCLPLLILFSNLYPA